MKQLNSLLHVDDFSFDYGNLKNPILNKLQFTLKEKETTILIGPSGSGKSSLALCLNGLYPDAVEGVSSGNIYYRGENVLNFQKGKLSQRIGIVFQDPESQFCMLTVEDELAFTLENRKIPSSEMPQRISEALRAVGMEGFQKRKIHELSGGQKQKIALASVLLLEPELLILDEPTANLDPMSRLDFIQLIGKLKHEFGITLFIIEHQVDDWLEIVDRVLVLGRSGKIIADGNVHSIFVEKQSLLKKQGIFLPKQFSDSVPFYPRENVSTSKQNQIILSVNNINFNRKNQIILKNIQFDIHQGEFLAIVGENGAGKSTLLQLMAGLLHPNHGEILFHNRPIEKWNEKELRKRVGYVFQNPEHQFITDTVLDELTFGMKLNGWTDKEAEATAMKLMKQFHLEQHKFSNPFSLSGGEKRRLSVATMLDEIPDILFFDEPTFGQDAETTKELMSIVNQLKSNGTAIVFVTHDMDIVDTVDRVLVLNEQKIKFDGIPNLLWNETQLLERARLRLPYRIQLQEKEGVPIDLVY